MKKIILVPLFLMLTQFAFASDADVIVNALDKTISSNGINLDTKLTVNFGDSKVNYSIVSDVMSGKQHHEVSLKANISSKDFGLWTGKAFDVNLNANWAYYLDGSGFDIFWITKNFDINVESENKGLVAIAEAYGEITKLITWKYFYFSLNTLSDDFWLSFLKELPKTNTWFLSMVFESWALKITKWLGSNYAITPDESKMSDLSEIYPWLEKGKIIIEIENNRISAISLSADLQNNDFGVKQEVKINFKTVISYSAVNIEMPAKKSVTTIDINKIIKAVSKGSDIDMLFWDDESLWLNDWFIESNEVSQELIDEIYLMDSSWYKDYALEVAEKWWISSFKPEKEVDYEYLWQVLSRIDWVQNNLRWSWKISKLQWISVIMKAFLPDVRNPIKYAIWNWIVSKDFSVAKASNSSFLESEMVVILGKVNYLKKYSGEF